MTHTRLVGLLPLATASALVATGCGRLARRPRGGFPRARSDAGGVTGTAGFFRPELESLSALAAAEGRSWSGRSYEEPDWTSRRDAARDTRVQTARGQLLSAGPRFGLVWVTRDLLLSLELEHGGESPVTVWGWQFEYQYEASAGGPIGLVEIVPMLAGLEWGLNLPSVSVFAGLRLPVGTEFVVGPYASPNGFGLGVAIGHTFRAGGLNFPVNVSVTRNNYGERYGITFGFNLRQ